MMVAKRGIIAGLMVMAIGVHAAFAELASLTGAELTALLAGGKTFQLGGPGEGHIGELRLNADGTAKGLARTEEGDLMTINGTWRIKGDQFCRTWKETDDGEVCETWVRSGYNRVMVMLRGEKIGDLDW